MPSELRQTLRLDRAFCQTIADVTAASLSPNKFIKEEPRPPTSQPVAKRRGRTAQGLMGAELRVSSVLVFVDFVRPRVKTGGSLKQGTAELEGLIEIKNGVSWPAPPLTSPQKETDSILAQLQVMLNPSTRVGLNQGH